MIENKYSSDSKTMPCNGPKMHYLKIFCYNYSTKYKCCHKYKVNKNSFSWHNLFHDNSRLL